MGRTREIVAVLLNNVWHSAIIDLWYANSRILWIKFKVSMVKFCVVVVYGPSEGDVEERDRFWNDMDRILDRVWNGYRLCILGDLNGRIEERMITAEEWWSSVLKGDCL